MGSVLAAASDATVAALRHRGASGAAAEVAPATPLAGQGFLPGLMTNSSAAVDEPAGRRVSPPAGPGTMSSSDGSAGFSSPRISRRMPAISPRAASMRAMPVTQNSHLQVPSWTVMDHSCIPARASAKPSSQQPHSCSQPSWLVSAIRRQLGAAAHRSA